MGENPTPADQSTAGPEPSGNAFLGRAGWPPRRRGEILQWLIEYRAFVLLGIALTYAVLFVPFFATERNITQMTTQFSIDGIISIGLTILMIAWGIDLGVGATLALGGVVFALAQDLGVPLAALLGILAGAGVGIVNGFVVTKMRVNFFIATLSTMVAVKGLTFIITDETTIYGHAEGFGWMGSAKLWIFEFPALAFFGIGIIAHLIMTQTSLGTCWYAIGGNSDASHRAGLNVKLLFALAFVVAGLCSGTAGVLLASRAVSANPGVGRDTALFAISATVIGGTSLFGGVGNVLGAVAGVLLLGVVRNSLNLLGVSAYWQWVIQGAILVSVVVSDVYMNRRRQTGLTFATNIVVIGGPMAELDR